MQCCYSGGAPPAATVVIVVCIAALVAIVVIGIYRIHATHQEGSRDDDDEVKDPEMDWESSALNITVNPMEVTVKRRNVITVQSFSERFCFNLVMWTTHKSLCLDLRSVFVLQDMRGPQALGEAVREGEGEEEDEEEDVELVGGMTTAESDKSDEEEEEAEEEREEVNKKQEKPEWDSSCTTY